MKKAIGALLLTAGLSLSTVACEMPEENDGTAADRAEVNQAADKKGTKDKKKADKPSETKGQENARRSAENYLDMSSFSREGLIKQLKFEGFSPADAAYGVDAQKANWKAQAAAKAEEYLDMSAFSRASLIQQLKFEGFTQAQAEHGATKVGL